MMYLYYIRYIFIMNVVNQRKRLYCVRKYSDNDTLTVPTGGLKAI